MTDSAAERYVRLGLRLGRHVDGLVDAYFGPPGLKAAVDAEPPVEPRTLVADADGLLGELEDGWLRDQVVGLWTYARALAGEAIPYADEVEGCYGVRPSWTEESIFAAAHERLEDVLPGNGSLSERHRRWEDSLLVPAERVEETIGAVVEAARGQTRSLVDLPAGEGVDLKMCATSRGGPSANTSATSAARSPSTWTSRCRPWSSSGWRCTRPTRAITPSAPARSRRSSAAAAYSRRRS